MPVPTCMPPVCAIIRHGPPRRKPGQAVHGPAPRSFSKGPARRARGAKTGLVKDDIPIHPGVALPQALSPPSRSCGKGRPRRSPPLFWSQGEGVKAAPTKGGRCREKQKTRSPLGAGEQVLAPPAGLEPATTRLTAECSAIELRRNRGLRRASLRNPWRPAATYSSGPFPAKYHRR